MNALRTIYHIALADFLERIRRYTFLITLLLVVWLGYLSVSGGFHMRLYPDYTGMVNSAWAGGTMALTVSFLLGFVGFYIVKGSIDHDYTTGVGQIMATTPMTRLVYMVGKWLSNYAVLGITVVIMLLEGIVMTLLADTAGFDLWAIAAPLMLFALPFVGLVAALAVLFESVTWLRGGLGNIVYFGIFMGIYAPLMGDLSIGKEGAKPTPYLDLSGIQAIGNGIGQAARTAYPGIDAPFTFSFTPLPAPKLFIWNGIVWTGDLLLSRLVILLLAVILVLAAAALFDRFNPLKILPIKGRKKVVAEPVPAAQVAPVKRMHLTPLTRTGVRFNFSALFSAELKLLVKGQSWWWYAVAGGLVVAQLVVPVEITPYLLVAGWVWLALRLSGLGCRENRFDTRQIVFSAPRPLVNQLAAAWLAAVASVMAVGAGALIKYILAGQGLSVLGCLVGSLFIPSLALALGVFSGASKAFEALYVLWMYALTQKVEPLDFAGFTPQSPLLFYAGLVLLLLAAAAWLRWRQLTGKHSQK